MYRYKNMPIHHLLKLCQPKRRYYTNLSHPLINPVQVFEEETLSFYKNEQYYPVHIGEIFESSESKSRYQIVSKLGYGAYSTVWLCQELAERQFAALKISTYLWDFPEKQRSEYNIYEHLCTIKSSHPGQAWIRELYDTFEVSGPHGSHQCLVQPVMHLSLHDMLMSNTDPLDKVSLKGVLKGLLRALDFLHTEANIIHTDLKTDNLMLTIRDPSILSAAAEAELQSPSPRKIVDSITGQAIYYPRRLGKSKNGNYGYPVLCDLGEARIGRVQQGKAPPSVQPHDYRAPEVMFEMEWGPAVDIWNVGALIWDLFEGQHLFRNLRDEKGRHDPFKHMAQIYALLGPPPTEFLPRSETTGECFDGNGTWNADEHEKVPEISLETLETRLEGEDKESFLRFIRSMMRWLPEERKTAKELLDDPWLNNEE